uniref:Uncharacterized protein n=1 Tax=Opuntia streptacantha TaxID=393608 RepID=A0A7C8YCS7_OPUST
MEQGLNSGASKTRNLQTTCSLSFLFNVYRERTREDEETKISNAKCRTGAIESIAGGHEGIDGNCKLSETLFQRFRRCGSGGWWRWRFGVFSNTWRRSEDRLAHCPPASCRRLRWRLSSLPPRCSLSLSLWICQCAIESCNFISVNLMWFCRNGHVSVALDLMGLLWIHQKLPWTIDFFLEILHISDDFVEVLQLSNF